MSREKLRSLESLLEGDPTYESFVLLNLATGEQRSWQIEDFYRGARACRLRPEVPDDVANLFLGARYSYLFSWFVYRLHPVTQTQALVCLEFGLKQRFAAKTKARDRRTRSLTLESLLRRSVKEGLVRDGGFRTWPGHKKKKVGDGTEWTSGALVPLLLHRRNEYAHGSAMLMPESARLLADVCDWLNQIFAPAPA